MAAYLDVPDRPPRTWSFLHLTKPQTVNDLIGRLVYLQQNGFGESDLGWEAIFDNPELRLAISKESQ